jgi:hypothetical protein
VTVALSVILGLSVLWLASDELLRRHAAECDYWALNPRASRDITPTFPLEVRPHADQEALACECSRESQAMRQ